MRCVSGCQRRVRREHNSGNHRVSQFAGAALSMAQCHQIASLLSCGCIKRSDSTLNLVNNDLLKSLNQCRASLPGGQNLQSVANLEYCDGTRPNGRASLLVKPFYHFAVRRVAHERRQNVRVEDDHRTKDAGSILYPRSSGISSSSPTLANSEAISVPRPPTAASCSFTAFRRMSRTSSSMLRPCRAARRRSLAFTSLSIFRTIN